MKFSFIYTSMKRNVMRSNTSCAENCCCGPAEIITSNIPFRVFSPLLIDWSGDYSFVFLSQSGPSTVTRVWWDLASHSLVLLLEKQEVLTVLSETGAQMSLRNVNHMVNVKPRFVCSSCDNKEKKNLFPCWVCLPMSLGNGELVINYMGQKRKMSDEIFFPWRMKAYPVSSSANTIYYSVETPSEWAMPFCLLGFTLLQHVCCFCCMTISHPSFPRQNSIIIVEG